MPDIKIDLKPLFEKLESKQYCVIKLPSEFPEYKLGSDIDIFCYDIEDISRIFLGFLVQDLIVQDLIVKVINRTTHIYIDIMDNEKIHLRFDLYGALPTYKNILLKEAFFSSVIENAQTIEQNGYKVKVPSQIDENIIRYIEYQEWYGQRPDKIKHIEYIEERIINFGIDINQLLDKLHYYTELPKIQDSRQVSSSKVIRYSSYLLNIMKKILRVIKEKGLKETFKLIVRKLKNDHN